MRALELSQCSFMKVVELTCGSRHSGLLWSLAGQLQETLLLVQVLVSLCSYYGPVLVVSQSKDNKWENQLRHF